MLRSTHGLLSLGRQAAPLPREATPPTAEQMAEVRRLLEERNSGGLAMPNNFTPTVPAFDPSNPQMRTGNMPQHAQRNPQSLEFLEMLGLPYNLDSAGARQQQGPAAGGAPAWAANFGGPAAGYAAAGEAAGVVAGVPNPEEIDLDDDTDFVDDGDEEGPGGEGPVDPALAAVLRMGPGGGGSGGGVTAAAAVAAAASNPEEISLDDE